MKLGGYAAIGGGLGGRFVCKMVMGHRFLSRIVASSKWCKIASRVVSWESNTFYFSFAEFL